MKDQATRTIIRFGVFEASVEAGELRRAGVRVKLQTQPFRVLALLIEHPGEIVTRAEIVRELWGNDTFVDFDQSVSAVIRKLRRALGDSAAAPRYIETLRQTGYRFLLPIHTEITPSASIPESAPAKRVVHPELRGSWLSSGLAAAAAVSLILLVSSGRSVGPNGPGLTGKPHQMPGHSRNIDAFIAYQKGRYLLKVRTAAALQDSIDYFQKAVNLDADYASAYAGLADAFAILNFYTGRNSKISIEQARAASGRALKLDGSMAEAHATQAYIKFYYDWDWTGAENTFRRAIALNPDYATARQWYAEYLFYMGRFEESLREINRAHELDPQSVVISLQLASPHLYARQYDQAINKIREALRMNSESALGIYMLGTCLEQLGRMDEALTEYRKISGTAMGLTGLAYAYGKSGRRQEARQILYQLIGGSQRDDVSAYHVARVYAGLGDTRETLAWLKKAQLARDERMTMILVDPKLDILRSNPLFSELLRSMGLPLHSPGAIDISTHDVPSPRRG